MKTVSVPLTEGQELTEEKIDQSIEEIESEWAELRPLLFKADLSGREKQDWFDQNNVSYENFELSDRYHSFFEELAKALGCRNVGEAVSITVFAQSLDDLAIMIRNVRPIEDVGKL